MDGRFVVDPDEVDSRCVCKQLFSSVERDLCIIVFFSKADIYSLSSLLSLHDPNISFRKNVVNIFSICYVVVRRVIFILSSLSLFFLNNLNNRINKCLLFDVNCETVGRGCNKNSQLLYNMNIYIYIGQSCF